MTHPLPYEDGISEDVYHNLFVRVGLDESLQQSFFKKRCESLSAKDAFAYDSSTISVYSENQNDARFGFNKAHDGLKTIKLLTLYSIDSRQPIAFTKQPGNLPDVISVTNAINQLRALGVNTTEIVTDNGYYSEQNLSELLQAGFDFITPAKTSLKFRKYSSHKNGAEKGSEEAFKRRIYLHIYFNKSRQTDDKTALDDDLYELKTLLESGTAIDDLSPAAKEKANKYFTVKRWGGKITATANNKAIKDANKYLGYFALVSNKEKDPFECLRKYRKRETIESFFEAEKQHADGTRARVWYTDTLRGRMFVQFISLCYYEYFSEEIRKLKVVLDSEINSGGLKSEALKTTKKLKTWVNNTPLYLQLQWFDTVEQVELSTKLRNRRWNTEVTSCDALYLEKIGLYRE